MLGRRPVSTRTVAAILAGVAIVGCIERATGPSGATGAEFAAHLVAQDGNSQRGAVSRALAVPISVKVTDAGGLAVKGATVTFSVRQGGGSVSAPTTASGAAGVASTVWTLGPKLGPQQMVAILSSAFTLDSTVFTATATNGSASHIDIDAGDGQRISVGGTLVTPLSAKVTDDGGNPVPDAPVTWTVASGGGQITVIRQNTDSTGRAFATWKLGTISGQQTANAAIASGVTVGFRATADAGAPAQLIQETGSGQTGVVGRSLSTLLSVRVVDSYGNGVRGAIVSFSADDGSISSIGSGTDSLGRIQGRWTLGLKVGNQSSLASLAGTAPVMFVATGQASNPTSVAIETGANQTQAVRQTLPLPLVVRVSDSFGNPVAGTAITWTIAQGGGSILATAATTDAGGRATAIWTLGGSAGSQLVTLNVPTLPLVVFTATATPGALDTLAIVAGNNQSGTVSTALGTPLIVRQVDANGNPVVGASVIFAIASGGGSVTPAIAATDVNGRATANWTLGSFAGAQTVTATAGAKTVTFVATGSPAGGGGGGGGGTLTPAQIVLISGNGQVGRSATQLPSPLIVEVRDASGIPVSGISVTFTQAVANSDGFTSPSPVTTGADGRVTVLWTLGHNSSNTTVTQSVAASLPATPAVPAVTFSATARPDFRIVRIRTPTIMSDTTGATIGYPGDFAAGLRDTLIVQVYDPSDSTGVQGVAVTWNVTTVSGGSAVNSVVNTDNRGIAKTTWSLVGARPSDIAHRMIASAAGIGQVEFQAHVFPGNGVNVSVSDPPGLDSAGTSSTFIVTVTDVSGNPIPGANVTTQAQTGGGTFTPPLLSGITTGSAGTALFGWKFGPAHGTVQSVTVQAQSAGYYLNSVSRQTTKAVATP